MDKLKGRPRVVVESTHEPRRIREVNLEFPQVGAHGLVVLTRGVGQNIAHQRRINQHRLNLRPFVVEYPQRIELRALGGLRVEIEVG